MSIIRDPRFHGSPCFRCGHYCCQNLNQSCRKSNVSCHLDCNDCKLLLNLSKNSTNLTGSKKTSPSFGSSDRQNHQKFTRSLSELLKPSPPISSPEPIVAPISKESGLNFDFNALSLGKNSVTVAQNYLIDPRIGSIWSWKLVNSIEESKNPNPIVTSFFVPRTAKLSWNLVFYRQNLGQNSQYQFRIRIFSTNQKDQIPIELDSNIIQLNDEIQFSTFQFLDSSTLDLGFYLISVFRIWNPIDSHTNLIEDVNPVFVVSLSGKEL